jgi:hypothetical protein
MFTSFKRTVSRELGPSVFSLKSFLLGPWQALKGISILKLYVHESSYPTTTVYTVFKGAV